MNINSTSESSTYTNSAYSNKGVSGLASGIDTESLVQSMLSGIQSKIDKQNQAQQRLEWKQEIYRDVIKDINSFQSKYFNLTSNSCIRLESFYNTMKTSVSNSAASVTAGSGAVDSDFKMQVAKLATNTSVTSSKVGTGNIETTTSNSSDFEYSREINIKIGEDSYDIDLKGVSDSDLCDVINASVGRTDFAEAVMETVTNYSDADGNALTFNADENKYYNSDNSEYTGAVTTETKSVLKEIKFKEDDSFEISGSTAGMSILGVSGKLASAADEDGNQVANATGINTNFATKGNVGGSVDITLDGVKKTFAIKEGQSMNDLKDQVQSAFGSTVQFNEGADGFEISVAGTGRRLSISANADTMEAIGFKKGTTVVSNQLVRTDTVEKLGIGDASDTDTKYSFNINGTDIEYTAADTVSSIMNKINSSAAGVNIAYDDLSDKFKMTSSSTGTGFDINLTGDDEGLFAKLGFTTSGGSLDQSTVKAGENAVVNINGVTVERASNDFTYNGLTVSLKSTTGSYEQNADGSFVENSDGTIKSTTGSTETKVDVSTSRDVDKIVDTLKSFVDDYNKVIEKLNGYTHEKATYKSYAPLTEAQKKEMTEKEVELWEEKAKVGLLRNDKDISSFLGDMRTAMYTGSGSKYVLSNIGINSSSEWSDYGKLSIDEDKLKSMLQTDAEGVKDLFVGENGLATRLNKICNETASTSSGSQGTLVTLAGVEGKGSESSNTIKTQLDAIQKKLDALNRTYESRKDRYWNQFNAMEKALSNMNSQSDWLSSMM